MSESFPRSHRLYQICNRNTLKLSYCCLPNIGNKILGNTARKYSGDVNAYPVNDCVGHRRGQTCPEITGICNRPNNIYNAKVNTNTTEYNYIGMSAPPLRLRVATHKHSFNTSNNQTVLSEKVKEIQNQNIEYNVTFKLLENRSSYKPESKRCELCIAEKFHIIYSNLENILNKKNEIISKCRHRSKFKLATNG